MPVRFLPFCIPVLILTVNEPDFMKSKVTAKTSLQQEGVWRVNFPGTVGAGTGMAAEDAGTEGNNGWLRLSRAKENGKVTQELLLSVISAYWAHSRCSYTHSFNWICKNQIQYLDSWIPGGHPGFQLSSKGDTHRTVRRFRQEKPWLFNNGKV